MSELSACLLVLVVAYALRAAPLWMAPQGAGVDHWFWKKYIETYRRERQFPPVLRQYLLDEAQWYPPVFPLFMAALPMSLFDRWHQHVAILVDLLRLGLLLAVVAHHSDGASSLLVAGLVYATTPIQVSYNVQLNPRGLAALMLDSILVLLLWAFWQGGPWWAWIPIVLLSGLVLLTHKMTTQLLVFLVLGTAAIYRSAELLVLIPAAVAAAMVLSGGFYLKVLRAHVDIVSFWRRHWRWIGADQIRESPIYGTAGYERPEKLHREGLRGRAWQLVVLFGFNPAAWIACLLVYERVFAPSSLLIYPTPFLVWLLLPCLFAIATTFIGGLKCVGAGYLYVYNTSVMASLVLGLTITYTRSPHLSLAVVSAALLLNTLGVAAYYRQFLANPRSRVDQDLDALVTDLAQRPEGTVMCIPVQWSEVVAYRTAHPVLWGGHGYGFSRLEPTWPRMMIRADEAVGRYGIKYLLVLPSLLTDDFIADLPDARVTSAGPYQLYEFQTSPAGRDGLD